MKHEWRKQEKNIYLPKGIQQLNLPSYNYVGISDTGDPNQQNFSDNISKLYPISYEIRKALKTGEFTDKYEYTVYPLEGVWTTSDGSRDENLNKNNLVYKIMIRQPEMVTQEIFDTCLERVAKKKPEIDFSGISFFEYADGDVVETIHQGSYDDEIETFKDLKKYLAENNLEQIMIMEKYAHREIYLTDARKTEPAKQKTVLRYKVQSK